MGGVQAPNMKRRWLSILPVFVVAGLISAAPTIVRWINEEPMIHALPARFQTEPFDIWRGPSGFTDFEVCMRVALSPEEVAAFIPKFFERSSVGVAVDPTQVRTSCEAPFWPAQFDTKTIAFEEGYPPDVSWGPDSGSGAVYERGQLYFWSYAW
jgi:hypothetical protein